MNEKDFENYLRRNYPSNKKENVYEWAEESLERMDVKLGMRDLTIMKLEESCKELAESISNAFEEDRKITAEEFNKAVKILESIS